MGVYDCVIQRRTIRRFRQDPIPAQRLQQLVNAGRLAPSGANLQPLEYIVVNRKDMLDAVFATTRWAAYIAPKGTPPPGERPVAYIVVLINRHIRARGGEHDCGAAVMNMILTAWEQGLGSCWIASIHKRRLRKILHIPSYLEIDSVLALGIPAEHPVLEILTDSVKYWKDENGVLHVPKRKLEDILHWNRYPD